MERPTQLLNTRALHEERLVSLWERLVTRLGIHTVRVLLNRAIWQTAQHHPDIALIHHDDAGFAFDAMEPIYATQPQEEIEAAFDELCAELLLILARLLGREYDTFLGPQDVDAHRGHTGVGDHDEDRGPAIIGVQLTS